MTANPPLAKEDYLGIRITPGENLAHRFPRSPSAPGCTSSYANDPSNVPG